MKIKNLTLGLALTGVSIFAQQSDIYKSSYTTNFSIEDHQSSLGTGVETSQGVRIWRYFILSANISYTHFPTLNKSSLPVKADAKIYFNNLKKEKNLRPFVFYNIGSNIKLSDNFLKGTASSVGLGLDFKIKNKPYNISVFVADHGYYTIDNSIFLSNNIGSAGIKLGLKL